MRTANFFASAGTEFNGFVRRAKTFLLPRGQKFHGFARRAKAFLLPRGLNLMVLCAGQRLFCFLGNLI